MRKISKKPLKAKNRGYANISLSTLCYYTPFGYALANYSEGKEGGYFVEVSYIREGKEYAVVFMYPTQTEVLLSFDKDLKNYFKDVINAES